MAIIELSTALVAAGSGVVVPFMNKVLEKSAQRVGGHVDEHLAALFTRAHEYLAPTGREAQSVEAKIAIPLMQAASLESDPALTEKWAALLANAADPAQQAQVQPGYVEVLRQLTPTDARVIEAFYAVAGAAFDKNQPHAIETDTIKQSLGLDGVAMGLSVDTMLRLRLCKAAPTYGDADASLSLAMPHSLLMTLFGWQFRAACRPPIS